jgi:hypothetical protein
MNDYKKNTEITAFSAPIPWYKNLHEYIYQKRINASALCRLGLNLAMDKLEGKSEEEIKKILSKV